MLETFPDYRGMGIGRELSTAAESIAAGVGKPVMSIIDAGARKLYQRQGYFEMAKRLMVKEAWQNTSVNRVPPVKDL